jgi:hypothetical protein
MASFVSRVCPNENCESHKPMYPRMDGQPPKALCELVGVNKANLILSCTKCSTQFEAEKSREKILKMTYSRGGYDCASTGQHFDSYSEQRAYEKLHKLEPM